MVRALGPIMDAPITPHLPIQYEILQNPYIQKVRRLIKPGRWPQGTPEHEPQGWEELEEWIKDQPKLLKSPKGSKEIHTCIQHVGSQEDSNISSRECIEWSLMATAQHVSRHTKDPTKLAQHISQTQGGGNHLPSGCNRWYPNWTPRCAET